MIQRNHHGIRAACAGLAAAAALLCAPASATTIDFSSLPPSTHAGGETLNEYGFDMTFRESPLAAEWGISTAIGSVVNPGDPTSCLIISCPVGADGNYLAITNDGGVRFARASGAAFKLSALDLAFITPVDVPDASYGLLRLFGTGLDGTVTSLELEFPGQNAAGDFLFGAANIAADFRALTLASLTIDACVFDFDNNCVNSLDNPANNQAQFALDNLVFAEVPEPASLLLLAGSFGVLLLQRRRQTTLGA